MPTPPLFLVRREALADVAPRSLISVDGPEGHHAADVQRLRVGEPVWLGDGAGRIARSTVASVFRGRIEASVDGVDDFAAPSERFVVAQALARGGRDEAAVETMTEVGVDEVIGWQAARSVARWNDKTGAKWLGIARSAAKQSRRAFIPQISGPATTADLAGRIRGASLAVLLDPEGQVSVAELAPPASGQCLIIVGPEGGFDPRELTVLRDAGATPARLGSNVLRASTAGVAAIAVLSAQGRWR